MVTILFRDIFNKSFVIYENVFLFIKWAAHDFLKFFHAFDKLILLGHVFHFVYPVTFPNMLPIRMEFKL